MSWGPFLSKFRCHRHPAPLSTCGSFFHAQCNLRRRLTHTHALLILIYKTTDNYTPKWSNAETAATDTARPFCLSAAIQQQRSADPSTPFCKGSDRILWDDQWHRHRMKAQGLLLMTKGLIYLEEPNAGAARMMVCMYLKLPHSDRADARVNSETDQGSLERGFDVE